MTKTIWILAGLLVALSFSGGYYLGKKNVEPPKLKPITKYIPIEVPKTVYQDRPVKEYIYKEFETVNLRVDTVYVPKEMKEYVVADQHPLVFKPKEVTFRYFDPINRRYQEDVYTIPPSRFRFNLTGGVGVDAIQLFQGSSANEVMPDLNLRADINFDKFGIYSSFHSKLLDKDWQARVGISYNILSK
jgi:hypothetical protein